MKRAAILIGVKKTGNLPELQAVAAGIEKMAKWARSHGIDGTRLKILPDESSEVRVHQITDAIEEIVASTDVEQLIVYFSGHGVVNNRNEYWLLSRAPGNANEAVNVTGSVALAGNCGIGHIVLISDACRTAAEGIQAQQITGSDIFPNELGTGREGLVDVFYACAKGQHALEVKDPHQSATEYEAIYTEVLAECLNGDHAEMLEYEEEGASRTGLVRPWPLRDFLETNIPKQLRKKLGREVTVNQTPTANITSRPGTWLSRIPGLSRAAAAVTPVSRSTQINPFTISEAMVSHAIVGDLQQWGDVVNLAAGLPEASTLKDAAETYATSFGPSHFETRCGFKLRGGKVSQVFCKEASAEILDTDGSIVRVGPLSKPGAVVLLELRNRTGVLLPAIPDFIAALTFVDNELMNVSYEPSDNTWRWSEYDTRREELRILRASVAASVGLGVFRLSGDDALALAQRMEIARGIDPSLSLYTAYAYHDLQRRDLIKRVQSCLRANLEVTFFDVSLLAGDRPGELPGSDRVAPPFPMLSQGWSLLPALRAKLPGSLQTLHQHLLPSSLWTMFDEAGVAMLAAAINSGEVR